MIVVRAEKQNIQLPHTVQVQGYKGYPKQQHARHNAENQDCMTIVTENQHTTRNSVAIETNRKITSRLHYNADTQTHIIIINNTL